MSKLLSDSHLNAWRLFITAHARLVSHIDAQLKQAGAIPLHWYDVLIELYEAPEQRLRMHELAERVVLSRSGLTRLVDRLEQEGFLQREADPQDRRGFYIVITPAGIAAMREAWPVYARGINTLFAAHLNEDDAAVLERVFSEILRQL